MTKAIIIHQHGGTEKMTIIEQTLPPLQYGEVRLRQTAIGVNFIDTYHRSGQYSTALPTGIGLEAAGVVEEIGEGVEDIAVGDRVVYGTSTTMLGAYATHRNMPASLLYKIPEYIDDATAVAVFLKGLTAHMLCRRVVTVRQGWNILVHSAAGGVGSLLCQWLHSLGCNVIGTVGSQSKVEAAHKNGCAHVIFERNADLATKVRALTDGAGVEIVYDGIGKDTFSHSLDCLAIFGLMCSYGQSSGTVENIDMAKIARGSLFLTRPTIAHYKRDRMETQMSAIEVFEGIKQGFLHPQIAATFPLAQAAEAHKLLESRTSSGAIVLVV